MTVTDTLAPELHRPLRTDDDLLVLLDHFFPVAIRRQLWTLFLDADDVALPIVVPVEDIPLVPDPAALSNWGEAVEAIADEFRAASVVFVVERTGSASSRRSDRAWHAALSRLGDDREFAVRAVVGCTDEGIGPLTTDRPFPAPPGPGAATDASPAEPRSELGPAQASPSRRAVSASPVSVR